ncbi:armadillo-type protein [Zychaea mexicana]|uniref:armadillo-type protein n=1 Tax=Zychaea mexicana TaxID=64656 RepID=UPI0022FEB966|nr:armadillo-type protein [Zychaea mexicana]KAI9488800.1 armadillo-type protein [Zychaea mexicana]
MTTEDEFDPDDILYEINRKLANVSLTQLNFNSEHDIVQKDTLPEIKYYLCNSRPNERECFQSVQMLRKYLTQASSSNACVDDILNLDVLPRLRELLVLDDQQGIQFEAAWIVTNIAAGSSKQTEQLVNADFIAGLLQCLHSQKTASNVKTQAAWALSNFAGESPQLRQLLCQNDAIAAVAQVLIDTSAKAREDARDCGCYGEITSIFDDELLTDIKALTWAISNMSRGGFYTADYWPKYVLAFEALSHCILFDHVDLWIDGGWGLSRILHNMHGVTPFYENFTFSSQLPARLAELLHEDGRGVTIPILRALINITSLPDMYCMRLIDKQLVRRLIPFMSPETETAVRRDTYLVVANLVACNEDFVERTMLVEARLIHYARDHICVPHHTYHAGEWTPSSNNKLKSGTMVEEWKITTDALWIICNFLTAGSEENISTLLDRFRDLPRALMKLVQYDPHAMPHTVATKVVDAMIQLVGKVGEQYGNEWFVDTWRSLDLENKLRALAEAHPTCKPLLESCAEMTALLVSKNNKTAAAATTTPLDASGGMAAAFGLNVPRKNVSASKRRVLHGFEDGDVRLIENAVGKLSI